MVVYNLGSRKNQLARIRPISPQKPSINSSTNQILTTITHVNCLHFETLSVRRDDSPIEYDVSKIFNQLKVRDPNFLHLTRDRISPSNALLVQCTDVDLKPCHNRSSEPHWVKNLPSSTN